MYKTLAALLLIVVPPLAGQNVIAEEEATIMLEAKLLAYSPRSSEKCGGDFIYQVAKYRVLKVLAGSYTGREIIVDHPSCDDDVFKRIPVGSRVRLSVTVERSISGVFTYPGIRTLKRPEDARRLNLFYVARIPPKKL